MHTNTIPEKGNILNAAAQLHYCNDDFNHKLIAFLKRSTLRLTESRESISQVLFAPFESDLHTANTITGDLVPALTPKTRLESEVYEATTLLSFKKTAQVKDATYIIWINVSKTNIFINTLCKFLLHRQRILAE